MFRRDRCTSAQRIDRQFPTKELAQDMQTPSKISMGISSEPTEMGPANQSESSTAAGVSHDSPRTPDMRIDGPGASNTKIPREDLPKRGKKERKLWRERKKARNFGRPLFLGFGPPTLRRLVGLKRARHVEAVLIGLKRYWPEAVLG